MCSTLNFFCKTEQFSSSLNQLNANHQIHALLLQLEMQKVDGKLPETLFVQVDGGPENANKLVLAVLSYFVAKQVCGLKKIVYSRLPVGHTHEDIDGIFGRISKYIYNRHVLTPKAYAKAIEEALKGKGKLDIVVHDLYVIPNYKKYFDGCIDKLFGCAYKEPHAKLQFIIESVPVSSMYPVGVKLTYRRFCQDLYPLLFPCKTAPFGVGIKLITSKVFPLEGKGSINVLLKLPEKGPFVPDPFVDDFLGHANKYFSHIEKSYVDKSELNKKILDELNEFKSEFPNISSSSDWVRNNPEKFYIPFLEVFQSVNPPTLDYRYADMRTTIDKGLLSGIEVEEDEDTLKRSDFIDAGGYRLLYKAKVATVKRVEDKAIPLFTDPKSRKLSTLLGLKYEDRENNTRHELRSIHKETDAMGKSSLQFIIQNISEDDSDRVTLMECSEFIKQALSTKSAYYFSDHETALKMISSLKTKPGASVQAKCNPN